MKTNPKSSSILPVIHPSSIQNASNLSHQQQVQSSPNPLKPQTEALSLLDAAIIKWKARFYEDAGTFLLLDLQALNDLRSSVTLLAQRLRLNPTSILTTGAILENLQDDSEEWDNSEVSTLGLKEKEVVNVNLAPLNQEPSALPHVSETSTFLTATNLLETTPTQLGEESNSKKLKKDQLEFSLPSKKNEQPLQMPEFIPEKPTPLPGKIDTKVLIKCTLDHRLDLSTGFRHKIQLLTRLDFFNTLIADLFWWFYIDQFIPQVETKKKPTQTAFYNRISENYVFCLIRVPPRHRDEFAKHFPDIISETVFECFLNYFPNTSSQFPLVDSTEFRSTIADSIYVWMTGVKLYDCKWIKWRNPGEPLPVPGFRNCKASNLDNPQSTSGSDIFLNLILGDDGKNSSDSKANRIDFLSTQSHPYGPGPPSHRVRLDVYGNSPMLQNFFKLCSHNGVTSHHRVSYIHFHQVDRFTKEFAERPTYRDLLMESIRKSKKAMKTYQFTQENLTKERNKANSDVTFQIRKEEQRFTKRLAKSMDVKLECEKLLGLDIPYHKLHSPRKRINKKSGTRIYQKVKLVPLSFS